MRQANTFLYPFHFIQMEEKETRKCHPQICLFDIKIILSWKQLSSSKPRKSSLFSAERQDINSPFTGDRLISPEMTLEEYANKPSPFVLPHVCLPAVSGPWKPKTIFLCPAISLQIYCSLLKVLSTSAGVLSCHSELLFIRSPSKVWWVLHALINFFSC